MSRPEDRFFPGVLIASAQVTADDVERAKIAWEKSAPPRFKQLLAAPTVEANP